MEYRKLPSYSNFEKLVIVNNANEIINPYLEDNLRLTVRQLFYQFVARGLLANTYANYCKVSEVASTDMRLAGLLPWEAIEDRTRTTIIPQSFASTEHLIEVAIQSYRLDRMEEQDTYIEVMVEKEALAGVLEPVSNHFGVPFTAVKGDSSTSLIYQIAQRIQEQLDNRKEVSIIYLGDLDPSGIRIPETINKRLIELMPGKNQYWELARPALTIEQVNEVKAPPNPVKWKDSNAENYAAVYGEYSWELDALPPRYLQKLIRTEIESRIDIPKFAGILDQEKEDIIELKIKLNK